MEKNSCQVLQQSAEWCEGSFEVPGIRKKLFFTACRNIVGMPELPQDANGHPTSVELTGNFTMAADKVFYCIDGIANKNQYTSTAQGEIPSQTQLNKLTVVYPSIDAAASALALSLNNTPSVVIFQDNNGRWRVIRNKYSTFKASVSQDSGTGVTGEVGTTIEIEDTDIVTPPFFNGTIVTEDGEISLGDTAA